MRQEYHKLIRDRIPEIIAADGRAYSVRQLSAEAYLRELARKLREEADEAFEAVASNDDGAIVKELADLLEVIEAVTVARGISTAEVLRVQSERRQKRGGFEKRLLLEWAEEPEADKGVSFRGMTIGQKYTRPELAERWGYAGYQALARGVVTPAGSPFIILFVTKEKQSFQTQYDDYIQGNQLFWEGESGHQNDQRIVDAERNGEEIHLFYRDIHHSPFVYYGRLSLDAYQLYADKPSHFIFELVEKRGRD